MRTFFVQKTVPLLALAVVAHLNLNFLKEIQIGGTIVA